MDDIIDCSTVVYVGHVFVFYIPVHKLDKAEYGKDQKTPRQIFESYLMDNFNAYTLEVSNTQGFWRQHQKSEIFQDENARYEVSFQGDELTKGFVEFLSEMCGLLCEEAIYPFAKPKAPTAKPLGCRAIAEGDSP